jgi:cobalt-zinc-cadmium efflux system protein
MKNNNYGDLDQSKQKDNRHSSEKTISSIRIAFFLNISFTVIEIVGGYWTNSLAILSDALHDLGDSFSLGLSWYLEKFSLRPRDEKFSYGYRRFSLLAALINLTVLLLGSILIIMEAVPRLVHPEHSNARGMVGIAIVGILVNGLAILRLRQSSKALSIRTVMLHLLEDVLGWTAVLLVGIVLIFRDVHILDPLLSLLIIVYVLINLTQNLKKTFRLLLQGVPEDFSLTSLENEICKINGILSVHHTHAWSLDGEHHILTTHAVISAHSNKKDIMRIKKEVRNISLLRDIEHVTIEIEFEDEKCGMRDNTEM